MEKLKQIKIFDVLFFIFIIVSIFHVFYASASFRGMYCDGAYFMVKQLNWLSSGIYNVDYDTGHTRFMILFITQLPVLIAHSILFIKSKYALMFIFTFFEFALPLFALWWSYKLAKRTEKPDIFFWNLFTYGGILLLYQIFSITESIQGAPFHFILWNYLTARMDYNKKDILGIIFVLALMFGTYEYVSYLGIFFFLCHFYYVLQDNSVKNQSVKTLIGFGCLAASINNLWVMFHAQGEEGEMFRFLGEFLNVIPQMFNLNTLITITAIILLIIFAFRKTEFKIWEIFIITAVFCFSAGYLFNNLYISLVPMWEGHLRTIPCWWLVLVFLILHIKDMVLPKYNIARWKNLICIALICATFQTFWQINNTYYWNKNIQYMKEELAKTDAPLYIADDNEEVSSFFNPYLRRYIWHGVYAPTSILFSDTPEQKTLLVNYDKVQDPGNGTYRNLLYITGDNKMSVPFGVNVNLKNYYWDLTDCAKALNEHNKKYHIETDG